MCRDTGKHPRYIKCSAQAPEAEVCIACCDGGSLGVWKGRDLWFNLDIVWCRRPTGNVSVWVMICTESMTKSQ